LEQIAAAMTPFKTCKWTAISLLANGAHSSGTNMTRAVHSVGEIISGNEETVNAALEQAQTWSAPAAARAEALRKTADLYEAHFGELFALATREAGKTLQDAVDELREAVDFLRYYANETEKLAGTPRGIFACISPWNFPLAIFTGQIAAAIVTGNAVIAKPAETTPAIASKAVSLMHEAGVPKDVLQLVLGEGSVVGAALCGDPRIGGVCFTGSTGTAKAINRAMADSGNPAAPLIAETGGLNAMIVDSTALPEQAVRDVIAGAFQSAGQRCSATRVLYVQEDVAPKMLEMLFGAMDALVLGDPWQLSTDVGPVIDDAAKAKIDGYISNAQGEGRLLKQIAAPQGCFVGPTVIRLNSISDLSEEIFGPVLHVVTFGSEELMQVIEDVNATGFGLTFGLHTRIDDRVQDVVEAVEAGNVYVNRNQIGAVVGVQPFGGEGLSGTGPKAGGPNYLRRFVIESGPVEAVTAMREMPGPTGETNQLSIRPRGRVLCLGPSVQDQKEQARQATLSGCDAVTPRLPSFPDGDGFDAVAYWGDGREIRQALANRDGPILPLITHGGPDTGYLVERHLCVDITASGGNAALMAGAQTSQT